MNANTPLYIPCEECDYKGTVRVKNLRGLTERTSCPTCKGGRLLKLNLTVGTVQTLIASRDAMAVELANVKAALAAPAPAKEPEADEVLMMAD